MSYRYQNLAYTHADVTYDYQQALHEITRYYRPRIFGEWNSYEETTKAKKPLMAKLNTMMKRILSKDTQTLIKAGYLDSELDLTNKGINELRGIMFEQHKAELVKLAEKELKDEANNND